MAKRFFDTDFFKKKFVKDLPELYRLFWVYLLAECNHSGIWECDWDVVSVRMPSIDKEQATKLFGKKITQVDEGEKWFIPSFIEFQYGQLSKKNKAHAKPIEILQKYNLLNQDLSIKNKDHTSPLQGDKDKAKEEDMDMEEEKEKKVDEIKNSSKWLEDVLMKQKVEKNAGVKMLCDFLDKESLKSDFIIKTISEIKDHFVNWLAKNKTTNGQNSTGNNRISRENERHEAVKVLNNVFGISKNDDSVSNSPDDIKTISIDHIQKAG